MLIVHSGQIDIENISERQREKIGFYFQKLMAQKPKETVKAYQSDLASFTRFVSAHCPGYAFTHDEKVMWDTVTRYLEYKIENKYKRSTIERRLSVIRTMLEVMGFPSPFSDKVFRDYITSALDNTLDVDPPKQATPFLEEQLLVTNKRGYFDSLGLRNLTMLNFAFDTLLRATELSRVKWEHIDTDRSVVLILKTKTNKGKRLDYRALSGTTLHYLDALKAITPSDAIYVFNPMVNTEHVKPSAAPLSYQSILTGMRSAITAGGFDGMKYSGHSCRVGAALSMRQSGIALEAIMEAGAWKSASTVHRYLQALEASYSGSAQLAKMSGR